MLPSALYVHCKFGAKTLGKMARGAGFEFFVSPNLIMVRRLKHLRYRSTLLPGGHRSFCRWDRSMLRNESAATVLVQTEPGGPYWTMQDTCGPLAVGDRLRLHETHVTGTESFARFQLSDAAPSMCTQTRRWCSGETPGITDLLDLFIWTVKVFIEHSKGANPKDRQDADGGDFRARHGVRRGSAGCRGNHLSSLWMTVWWTFANLTAPGPSVLLKARRVHSRRTEPCR